MKITHFFCGIHTKTIACSCFISLFFAILDDTNDF
jgi:hypothetical protein